jgi:hypothetical protein
MLVKINGVTQLILAIVYIAQAILILLGVYKPDSIAFPAYMGAGLGFLALSRANLEKK